MFNTEPALIGAIRELSSLSPARPAALEDLVALSAAREYVDQLLRACAEELRADPQTAHIFAAMSYAVSAAPVASAPVASAPVSYASPYAYAARATQPSATRTERAPYGSKVDPCDGQVSSFWQAFAEHFAWDFLPGEFLHALYTHWMSTRRPCESPLSKEALTRRLKAVVEDSGEWLYTRSRPGILMDAAEPLAELLPHWSLTCPERAVYGLRRSSTVRGAVAHDAARDASAGLLRPVNRAAA